MELPMYAELVLELVSINKQLGDRGIVLLSYDASESKFAVMAHLDEGCQFRVADKYLTITLMNTKLKLIRLGYLPIESVMDVLCLVAEVVRYCPELQGYYDTLKGGLNV